MYGTSIGLDRPLASILLDIKAALDPRGAVLSSWNASQLQPCRPWTTSPGTIGQLVTSPGYGGGWRYISTSSAVTSSADYCLVRRGVPCVSACAALTLPCAPSIIGLARQQPERRHNAHNQHRQLRANRWHRRAVAVRPGSERHSSGRAARAVHRSPGDAVSELADGHHPQRMVRT